MSQQKFITTLPHVTAIAWEILKRFEGEDKPRSDLIVLVPDNIWALNVKDDLQVLAPGLEIHFLPALETDLLRNRGPSVLRRMERIRFLAACQRPDDRRVFIVTAESLAQRIGGPRFWAEHSLRIRQGEELARSELTERLVELGYVPAELVEAPAEFAVRGSIVDVFPPGYEHPVRVELFDDRVQSLRLFHPESQRRLSELDSLHISPCHEFIYPADEKPLKQALRRYLDERDWPRLDRDAFLDRIQQKSFFATIDYWAPLIHPEAFEGGDAWAFLDLKPLYVVEPAIIDVEFRAMHRSMERAFETARVEGDWVPDASAFLTEFAASEARLRSALKQARFWFSLRQSAGLIGEPSQKESSSIRSHESLSSRLAGSRNAETEEPLAPLVEQVREWAEANINTVFMAPTPSQLERLQFLLGQYSIRFKIHADLNDVRRESPPLAGVLGSLQQGFQDPSARLAILLDEEIFGTKKKRAAARSTRQTQAKDIFTADFSMLDLKPGDFVVHDEHGIGRYLGTRVINFNGVPSELVEIEYKGGSKLLVPVTRLDAVHRHSGTGDDSQMDRLGGQTWETKKAKVKKDLQNIAGELILLYSKREMSRGPAIQPDKRAIDEFAATFAYVETPDQADAIEKVLKDIQGPRPMDRLVCGDVGYGKTEVALRATHAAVAAGFQVAVLVPTTILAAQHENTFRKRLGPLGAHVAGLSRFRSAKESKAILKDLSEGKVDVIVGTHKLLSSDVRFTKLGLLIVDEEQRFGVVHKEKIKRLRADVHVLTLSATPIPRTLNMALSGLKEISVITTPPQDRLSVRTHVARKKMALVQEAVQNEIKRGGQVYYLHNRIQTMQGELEDLQRALPGVAVETVHGQMEEHELEKRMLNFYEGRTQVLLTTAIIESGLDIPNANTLIVDRADSFGLSQLYQIRGRVGRSNQRAYAYFLLPEKAAITADAEERLSILESYQELGSGFHIASHDLEIRGAGDLLGGQQSGHILSIGLDAYLELLEEAVAESRGEPVEHLPEPELNLGLDTTIPEAYVPEIGLRLTFYRKAAAAHSEEEIDRIEAEIDDRFGSLPTSVKNLLSSMRIKCQLKRLGVRSLTAGKAGFALMFNPTTPVNPAKIVASIKRYPTLFQMNPDGRLIIKKAAEGNAASASSETGMMHGIEGALTMLESWCG